MENRPSPPPSDDDTNKGDGEILKTALQVLAELAGSESPKSNHGSDGGGGGDHGISGGTSSLALAVGGGPPTGVVQGGGGGGGEGSRGKKRKSSEVKDPPSGKPSCPLCFKEFNSWKGAFGHMRKHPDREYRGFYKPPVEVSPQPLARQILGAGGENSNIAGEGKSGGNRSSSPIRGVVFDLNQQPVDGTGTSNAAEEGNEAPPAADQERINVDEAKNPLGFDLNELPPADED